MKLLFLYTELADYTISCMKALKESDPSVDILAIHFPVNPEAPFIFDLKEVGTFKCVESFKSYSEFKSELRSFGADKIVCSGWVNRWYLRFCIEQRKKAACILLMDNTWSGTARQWAIASVFRTALLGVFRKIWVPGPSQVLYARKMGFDGANIMTGYYSGDKKRFDALYEKHHLNKKENFPRRMLCVARYIPQKNYNLLWNAFAEWKNGSSNAWELWCAGTGAGFPARMIHPAIRHLGFIQKDGWGEVIANTGVFILPSCFEPWGVAVHEFAAAGFPMILSEKVGASEVLLTKENGFRFNPSNKDDLIKCFEKMDGLSDEGLYSMGVNSHQLSDQITPSRWAHTLLTA